MRGLCLEFLQIQGTAFHNTTIRFIGVDMKKIYPVFFLSICLMTSCNSSESYEDITITASLIPKTNYETLYMTDVGTGFIHSKNSCIWYLDYETEIDVPFCSNPACTHNNDTCDAEFSGSTYIYNNIFIDMDYKIERGANEEWIDVVSFIKSDLNGQNRNTISQLNYYVDDMQAYEDKLYLSCLDRYYIDGEETFTQPSHSKAYLAEISLETGEITYLSECLGDGWNMGISLRGMYAGELYFQYSYSDEYEGDYTWASELTWHSQYRKLNLKTYEITEISEEEYFYLYIPDLDGIENNCRSHCTENEIVFETTDKTCKLYYDSPVKLGIDLLLKKGDDIYFSVFANENSLFKYSMDEEKLYEAVYSEYTDEIQLYAVTSDSKYIFGTYDRSYKNSSLFVAGEDNVVFLEVDADRFNEICGKYSDALKNNSQ